MRKKKKKLIINIIAILLMLTGPVLMILPGPQVLSWVGLLMFMWNNKTWFQRWLWSYYFMCKVENKVDRIKSRCKKWKDKRK